MQRRTLSACRSLLVTAVALVAAACSVNPVTGKRELILVSPEQELQMGEQAYFASQQAQGGEYDIDPELTRYVRDVGYRLAAVSDRNLPYEFVILNNSVPNAWALPGGKIAINRGLLTELDSEAELAAVLGHEIVHAAARHSAQQVTRGMLSQALVLTTAIVASDTEYGALAVGGAGLAAQLVNTRYGRSAELESDRYGMEYMSKAGYDPQGAVHLQETFVRLNDGHESDWLNGLFASHPPSPERVSANRATAAALPAGGRLGRDEFRQQMQRTLNAEAAYAMYDEGRKALADGDRKTALDRANAALDLLPEEAHFHALRGDVRMLDKNYKDAITNYTRAMERRDKFFYYHLQRGLARRQSGDLQGAKADLERSRELMPTAPAEMALGNIAEREGRIDAAIEHYKVVAKAGGDVGQSASRSLARIELPRQPGAYFATQCGADSNGNLVVAVQNRAPVAVSGVVVAIDVTDSAGQIRRYTRELGGTLASGAVGRVNTGLGPYSGASCPVGVIDARIVER